MKYAPLFNKYQEAIVDFANTNEGRKFLDIPEEIKRVDAIDRNSVAQVIGWDKDRPVVKRVYDTKNSYLLKLRNSMIFDYLEVLTANKIETKDKYALIAELDPTHPYIREQGYPVVMHLTDDFEPDADPETTSVDGYVAYDGAGAWATARGAATGTGVGTTNGNTWFEYAEFSSPNYNLRRGFFLFDTSSLAGGTVDSAELSVYVRRQPSGDNANNGGVVIVPTSPASNTNLTTADFDQVTFSSRGSRNNSTMTSNNTRYSITVSDVQDIVTGITKYGLISSLDLNNSAPTGLNALNGNYADEGSEPPRLSVVYTAAAGGFMASFIDIL